MYPAVTKPRAVVLLSGGLDSYTAAAVLQREGLTSVALTVRYGQRHAREIESARGGRACPGRARGTWRFDVDLAAIGGSALTDDTPVPKDRAIDAAVIPSTYVPARNTVFLSLALAWAEVLDARDIAIGVNALDYSGYPDCRPEYLEAFERLAALATRAGVEGGRFRIHAPLLHMSKAEIIRTRRLTRPRVRAHAQLLRSRPRWRSVRPLRQLRAARKGLCGGGGRRPAGSE